MNKDSDLAFFYAVRQQVELLPEDKRIQVMTLVDQLQAIADTECDQAVASMALTLVAARHIINVTGRGGL